MIFTTKQDGGLYHHQAMNGLLDVQDALVRSCPKMYSEFSGV